MPHQKIVASALVAMMFAVWMSPLQVSASSCWGGRSTNVLVMTEQADLIVIARRFGAIESRKLLVLKTLKGTSPGRVIALPGNVCDPFLQTRSRHLVFLRKDKYSGHFQGVATSDSAIPLNGSRFASKPVTRVAPAHLLRFVAKWVPKTSETGKANVLVDILNQSRGIIKLDALQYAFSYAHLNERRPLLREECKAISTAIERSRLSSERSSAWKKRRNALCSRATE